MSRKQKKNRESSGKSTYFNVDWQNVELYPDLSEWVDKVEGENQYCKWCNQTFFSSGMEKRCTSCKIKKKTLKDLGPENNSSFGFKHLPI